MKNYDRNYGNDSGRVVCDPYLQNHARIRTFIDGNGHKWWYCQTTVRVKDRTWARNHDWFSRVYSQNKWIGYQQSNYQSCVYFCQSKPRKLALLWNYF